MPSCRVPSIRVRVRSAMIGHINNGPKSRGREAGRSGVHDRTRAKRDHRPHSTRVTACSRFMADVRGSVPVGRTSNYTNPNSLFFFFPLESVTYTDCLTDSTLARTASCRCISSLLRSCIRRPMNVNNSMTYITFSRYAYI
jgi:hypothetical protein